MSRHPSLKSTGKIRKKRNVLKKFERVDLLSAEGRWKPGQKVITSKYSGTEVKMDGEEYTIVRVGDILAVAE